MKVECPNCLEESGTYVQEVLDRIKGSVIYGCENCGWTWPNDLLS